MPSLAVDVRPTTGLVLSGGGARAAYQVGVLRAIADMVPAGTPSPFQVLCGTSAGAINAAAIAADAGDFRRGVRRLVGVWKNFHAGDVYRSDVRGIAKCGARWLAAVLLGGLGKRNPISLLDNAPLADLLARHLDFTGIQRSIDCGALAALAVTASGYTSGESISFFEGSPELEGWRRSRRVGVRSELGVAHLMASAAIPFMFPPVRLTHEFFGDGSMRQIAPISPALHLGADRVMIVSVARVAGRASAQAASSGCPSLAQIAGHALNSIFLDALEADLERLERINRTVGHLHSSGADTSAIALKRIDYIVLSPSQELDQIASRHLNALPYCVRFFLRGIGAMRRSGSNLASYVLFERPFCRALLKLGYEDTTARREEVMHFLGLDAAPARIDRDVAPRRASERRAPHLRIAR
jgi:NTE family protein